VLQALETSLQHVIHASELAEIALRRQILLAVAETQQVALVDIALLRRRGEEGADKCNPCKQT
jgi:hypothetical protein